MSNENKVKDMSNNKKCPFCSGEVDPDGWLGDGGKTRGPECSDCGATAGSIDDWNTRAPQAASDSLTISRANIELLLVTVLSEGRLQQHCASLVMGGARAEDAKIALSKIDDCKAELIQALEAE
jgi:hypothetical protein